MSSLYVRHCFHAVRGGVCACAVLCPVLGVVSRLRRVLETKRRSEDATPSGGGGVEGRRRRRGSQNIPRRL